HDKASPSALDQVPNCGRDLLEKHRLPLENPSPKSSPADLSDNTPQVGLKHHNERDQDKGTHVAQKPIQGQKMELARDSGRHKKDAETHYDTGGVNFPDEEQKLVDHQGHNDDIQRVDKAKIGEEGDKNVHGAVRPRSYRM